MKRLKRKRLFNLLLSVFLFILLISAFSAYTASNIVPSFSLDEETHAVGPNSFKPPECADIDIQNVVDIGAGESPTNLNDLILGTPNRDVVDGLNGDDCILGGGGNDLSYLFFFVPILPGLYGGDGNDVILGGPDFDICAGNAGSDIIYCEWEQ